MKPSTAKAKGAETEIRYVNWLIEKGLVNAERRHLSGQHDKGDIAGWCAADGSWNVCVEVKNGGSLNIPKWLRELETEMKNAGSVMGHVAVRPKGKPNPKDWWVIMPAELHMQLMKEAGYWP